MASLSAKDENFVRLALLLTGLSPRAVRVFFDKEFPPTHLPSQLNTNYNTLYDLKLKRVLNQAQWNILFPKKGVPNSNTFDIPLMICIIRNLTSIKPPINGFDELPLPMETSPGSDLARIKWYRNILAHYDSTTMSIGDFNIAWSNITEAVSRLSSLSMNQECQELKVIILDQSNEMIMLEIKQSQEEIKELRQTMTMELSTTRKNLSDMQDSYSTLQTKHSKLTELFSDTVPWNIRAQINEELEHWREDDKTFIETNGAKSVLNCIKTNGCVVVTSSPGNGKTSLVRHVAIQMQNESYEILPVSNPTEIIAWYNPNKKILFVVDDFCGTYSINQTTIDNWYNLKEKIKALVEKKTVKLIMSCRLQVYQDIHMKSLSFFQSCECNLLSADLCLSKTEKQSIAEFYLKKTNASKIKTLYDKFDCFPLLCKLYSKNQKLNIVNFFTNPFTVYKEEIDKLRREAPDKYCALALCVVFNNYLKENWLTENIDEEIKTIIENTYEACKVVKGTSRLVLRDELDSLTHTFIRKDGEVYRTIHDKLFDFLAFYFGSKMIYCLINNATSQLISERFLFEKRSKKDELTIIVPEKYQQMFINRMVEDWFRGYVKHAFCNINMDNHNFRQRYLLHVKGMEISKQKQLSAVYDRNDNSTALIICCFIGDVDLVKWCLCHCFGDLNNCRKGDGVSPLMVAVHEGHIEIVQMLLDNKADINKCTDIGESPLFFACCKGHTDVVQMLLNNKADINKCRDGKVSPLFIACQEGHLEVAKFLINNKANINVCTDNGESPLFFACQEGHTKVVNLLVHNKADIDKSRDGEVSPLFVACQVGNIAVVKILINNMANIDMQRDTGETPLYIACHQGHTEVVNLLINNKADINKCNNEGTSPLFIACQKGHVKIVQMLMDNMSDINKCNDKQVSPLFIACQKGHTAVVKMLIDNEADINKCRDIGASPLCIACQTGHIDIVQILLKNKADINKCNDEGISPLFVACLTGHTELVQLLLNNRADIKRCNSEEESPLFVACKKGHTEIVQILINYKADINKCNHKEESPLSIACLVGHTAVAIILINNKADMNKCIDIGASPLYIACRAGNTEIVQMLLKNTTDINKCDDKGMSPLSVACLKGHTEVVQILIKNMADINKCNITGMSPIFIACLNGHKEICELLLEHKANCDIKFKGMTPLDISRRKNHKNIVHLLERGTNKTK